MTLEAFYAVIDGDYVNTKARFMSDDRIRRFVNRFPADQSYNTLVEAEESGNIEEAFRAAHTLKGVAQNLGFTALYECASKVTEVLRSGSLATKESIQEVGKIYRLVVDSIALIDA